MTNLMNTMNVIVPHHLKGVESREFMNALKEHIRIQRPQIIMLMEMHISGTRADTVCNKIGYRGRYQVEARGFQGGIWILWPKDTVYPNLELCDKPFWGGIRLGEFSIQSAIDFGHKVVPHLGHDRWQAVWRLKVPQKMKSETESGFTRSSSSKGEVLQETHN
ncbi:hypothetical protein Cgig2_017283 [Carnegiea gigantea]|uniref:Uncharacterized protein n=1 Tax=Carnegiea gigantea TaxID=171969 RepID=A0A9Q1QIU0_9CARY|nr:hypothetical protein Cgig2_017283 [Carnegiea gigantea]